MNVIVDVRNESAHKRLYTRAALTRLAECMCIGEAIPDDVELSLLLCDDPFIAQLNRQYRNKSQPTDVLSFIQDAAGLPGHVTPRPLGDIVVSLETVERHCRAECAHQDLRKAMREEMRLLFCHGLLHLLGYVHNTASEQRIMIEKQARYLRIPTDAAWRDVPPA